MAFALAGVLLITPLAEGRHLLIVDLANAKARASGGAFCSVTEVSGSVEWIKIYQDGTTTRFLGAIDYEFWGHGFQVRVFVDLEAPGWFDRAFFKLTLTDPAGTTVETIEKSTDQPNWEFTQYSSRTALGVGAEPWRFVVEVWGTDFGSQTCRKVGEFQLDDV